MFGRDNRLKRISRPFIAIVVAYAIAAQALLITLGGFAAFVQADTGAPTAFVVCAHNTDGAPAKPADGPVYPGCNHCILCFAGTHHAVIGSPVLPATRIGFASIDVAPTYVAHAPPRLASHSIASPRGPPLHA
jgi:hypothetical protein